MSTGEFSLYPLLAVILLLQACAGVPSVKPTSPRLELRWETYSRELSHLETWKVKGRLAIQAGQDGWTAAIHWDQNRDDYRIRLLAPLGQGTYELTGSKDGVVMLTADNRTLYAQDPGQLLRENLGWELRLSGLKFWIRGLPEPGVVAEEVVFNNEGRISDMQQAGWRVSILRYVETGGYHLPGKLFMHNDRFKLRLVIQDWETTQ
ncbi:MAG: lipoprotein insertase outer membrane protein LolB [Gammaproteobacteria bacterium]